MKNFVYKDIGQHGSSYDTPADTPAPKLKLPKQKPATKLHKRILKSLTLARPERLF